jgi:hypothetical protein
MTTFNFDYETFYNFYKKNAVHVNNFGIKVYYLVSNKAQISFREKELSHMYRIRPQVPGQKPLLVWLDFSVNDNFVYFICPNQNFPQMFYADHFTLGLDNQQVALHRTLYEGTHCRIKKKNHEWCRFLNNMTMNKNEKVFDFDCMGANVGTTLKKYNDGQTYLNAESITMILKEPFLEMTDQRIMFDDPRMYDEKGFTDGIYGQPCSMQGGSGLTIKENKTLLHNLQQMMKKRNLHEMVAVINKAQDRVELFTTRNS